MSFKERLGSRDIAVAGKWLFYFILIGVIAGCGAIIFHYLCGLGMHFFLDMMAGYCWRMITMRLLLRPA